jgi:hypothetical protein
MPEKISFEIQKPAILEKEISKERIKPLADWEEVGSYYRGVNVEDALRAIFGELKLEAEPKEEILGTRDNASLNLHEAIYFSRSSETKDGKKFLCAIGFDPLPGSKIEKSYLGRNTFVRITGNVVAKEIILRFAGKKPGQPQKRVRYFSPKEFYQWCKENLE